MRIRALLEKRRILKIMFSKKATKIDEIFTVDLMLCSKRQIDSEDFVNFHGLLKNMNFTIKMVKLNEHNVRKHSNFLLS